MTIGLTGWHSANGPMHRLSAMDSGFLLTESQHSPKHVAGLQVLRLPSAKGSAWLRKMLAELKRVPPGFPFNQRLRDANILQPVLVTDDRFDIDYHVCHSVLPRPGSDAQLVDMVARLHANLLDRERPLWEFHLIEGLRDRRFAFYTKIHHAIADGATFARWFAETGSRSPGNTDCPPIWHRDEPPVRDGDDRGPVAGVIDWAKMLAGGLQTANDLSALCARLIQKGVLGRDRNAVLPLGARRTRFNVPTGAARAFGICRLPLDEFAAVAHAHGASINDLLMTLCDLAVNRYLAQHGEAPDQPLVALMPVNLRQGDDDQGNVISLLQVRLASRHDDPIATLQQIRESSRSTRALYQSTSRSAIQLYSLAVNLLPLAAEWLHADQLLPPIMNLVISNVPGPCQAMFFRGAEVTEAYPVNTLPPAVALSATVCSYRGELFFGLISGRTAVPDLPRLVRQLEAAYREIRERPG